MGGTVLPFQKRKPRKPLAKDLARHVRKMLNDGRMIMPYPHVKQWLLSRNITAMQMLTTIEKGAAVGDPQLDARGDWRITLQRLAAGRKVQVTVAVKEDHFVVVKIA
jgi:putative transcriptional regulator